MEILSAASRGGGGVVIIELISVIVVIVAGIKILPSSAIRRGSLSWS